MVRTSQFIHPQREPAPLLKAATVLLLRDGPTGLEVLMTRRSTTASFAPGAYVFPGGGIDETDAQSHALAKRRSTQTDTALSPKPLRRYVKVLKKWVFCWPRTQMVDPQTPTTYRKWIVTRHCLINASQ